MDWYNSKGGKRSFQKATSGAMTVKRPWSIDGKSEYTGFPLVGGSQFFSSIVFKKICAQFGSLESFQVFFFFFDSARSHNYFINVKRSATDFLLSQDAFVPEIIKTASLQP